MTIEKQIQDAAAIYRERIDGLTDELERAKAKVALAQYTEAEQAYLEQVKATAASYSGTGMSVTKRTIEQSRMARDHLLADLEGILGLGDGSHVFVDFGGDL